MKTRITKIEKGCFVVEYTSAMNPELGEWKMLEKTFKTRPKAEKYIIEHFK